jgi:hypothetical protein
MGFRQQGQAGRLGKPGIDEEIAVAGHPVDGGAGVGHMAQGIGDGAVEGIGEVVVAGPVFEDVAEQVELVGMHRALGQEAEEGFGRARVGDLQVQVGNEKRKRARGCGHRVARTTARARDPRVMPALL